MEKRGQTSTFVLVGFIIVFLIIGITFTKNYQRTATQSTLQKETALPQSASALKSYIDSCLKDTLETDVQLIASQSGFYPLPENTIQLAGVSLPLAYEIGNNMLPSKQQLEANLQSLVSDTIGECIDLQRFPKLSIAPKGQPQTTVSLTESSMKATLNYPIEVKQGSTVQQLKTFSASVNAPLLEMLDTANSLIAQVDKDPFSIPLSFLDSLPFKSEVITQGDLTIYNLLDEVTIINNNSFTFTIVVRTL